MTVSITAEPAGLAPATYTAAGTGATSDRTPLQAAINHAATGGPILGGTVHIPPGTYGLDGPLVVPPGVTVVGPWQPRLERLNPASRQGLKLLPTFSALGYPTAAAVLLLGNTEGGTGAARSTGQRIYDLVVDGSAYTAAPVHGVAAYGLVHGVVLDGVGARAMSGNGFYSVNTSGIGGSGNAYSWRVKGCVFDSNTLNGMVLDSMTDCTFDDVQAIGNGRCGFINVGASSSLFSKCRAEWNGEHGWDLDRGVKLSDCHTDSNGWHGFYIHDLSFNFHAQASLTNCTANRDGRNTGAGGGGYAGIRVENCAGTVLVNGCAVSVGRDDGGTGVDRPENGMSFSNNTGRVKVDGASLAWGVLNGWQAVGTNTGLTKPGALVECAGTFAGQVYL